MAGGLVQQLSRGVLGYTRGQRLGREEEAARSEREADRAARARRQLLEENLLNVRLEQARRPRPPRDIDPLSPEGIKARLQFEEGSPRTRRGAAAGQTGVDQRATVAMANRLYEDGEFESWDDAYAEALRRMQTVGRLRDLPAPGTKPSDIQVPQQVRDYIARHQGGTPPTGKTPAQWVAEVRREHPDWPPEQIAAEARRRAGR